MKQILFAACFLLLLGSCGVSGQSKLKPADFQSKLEKNTSLQLVDVRTAREFAQEHLDKAINIDVTGNDFEEQFAKLDKEKPVFIYCRSGGRSGRAAHRLKQLGFQKIIDLEGGILAWKSEGKATVK